MQEIAPRQHAQRRRQQVSRERIGPLQVRGDDAQQILQHKARRTGSRIHRRQDKQRFKQDGEVIPERHVHQPAQRAVENVGHAHRQRRCPTRAGDN